MVDLFVRRGDTGLHKMSILIPLYIYPWPGVWDPLYWAYVPIFSLSPLHLLMTSTTQWRKKKKIKRHCL